MSRPKKQWLINNYNIQQLKIKKTTVVEQLTKKALIFSIKALTNIYPNYK